MNFLRKSVASMVIVAMFTLGLAPVVQAQEEKKDSKLLAVGIIGGLVFMGTTLYTGHKNKQEIVKLRYEAMVDRRAAVDGLARTNARLNAVIESMEKRQRALRGEDASPELTVDTRQVVVPREPQATRSTRDVGVKNASSEEVFLRNIITDDGGEKDNAMEWAIPAGGDISIILLKKIPLEKLFAVDRNNQPLTIDIIRDDKEEKILINPNG